MRDVTVRVDDATAQLALYGAGARLWLQKSATESGTYADVTFQTLLAGDDIYVFPVDGSLTTDWFRNYVTKADNSAPSEFSEAFQQGIPLVVTPGQVRVMSETGLTNEQLVEIIVREEAYLASVVGPLTGERTETFNLRYRYGRYSPITLTRRTDAVTVTEDAVALDPADFRLLSDGRTLRRLATDSLYDYPWTSPIEVTYTPNDRPLVERALLDMIRVSVTSSPFQSESIGDYSYTRGASASVASVARRYGLLPQPVPTSVRLSSPDLPRWFS